MQSGGPADAAGTKPDRHLGGEDELLQIWQQVLGSGDLLPDRSFFEQGGSSLAALNVLSRYFNKGYALTLTQFYACLLYTSGRRCFNS